MEDQPRYSRTQKFQQFDAKIEPLFKDPKICEEYERYCQRFGDTIRVEHDQYFEEHPEIDAMIKIFLSKSIQFGMRKSKSEQLRFVARHFTRPFNILDTEVRKNLNIPPEGHYVKDISWDKDLESFELVSDLLDIKSKYHKPPPFDLTPEGESDSTAESSSFLSAVSSNTTVKTPETPLLPSPTTSEIFYGFISKIVEKAVMLHVSEAENMYDVAYVEVLNAVEDAMETTVKDIREDIAALIKRAFHLLDIYIEEKAMRDAKTAWENRMRKKMKKTLRLENNFKGYETPLTPKSVISSHDSYKKPPLLPCVCYPRSKYNRYPKDRFGTYLPGDTNFCHHNITASPSFNQDSLNFNDKFNRSSFVNAKCSESTCRTSIKMGTFKNLSLHK